MREEEAEAVARALGGLPARHISPCVNIGSSTARFREVDKPHIDAKLFRPLRDRGIRVIHVDMKSADGVDISGDLYDPAVQTRIRSFRPRSLLCNNILEHVTDRPALAEILAGLLEPDGVLVVSVPLSYPYHADPIDTMFRPSPRAIAALFPGMSVVHEEVIVSDTALQEMRQGSHGVLHPVRMLAESAIKTLLPFRGRDSWRHHAQKLTFLLRPYRISLVVLRRLPASAS